MSLIKAAAVQIGKSSTASQNFHWSNLLDGLLRLSRGNAEDASPVDVIRVKVDNSVEFPGGIVDRFKPNYVSAELPITVSAVTTLTHLLGMKPHLVQLSAICVTSEIGFPVGMETPVHQDANNNSGGATVGWDSTNIRLVMGTGIPVHNASGSLVYVTAANWRLIVRAWV